jgi:hypothetical protein
MQHLLRHVPGRRDIRARQGGTRRIKGPLIMHCRCARSSAAARASTGTALSSGCGLSPRRATASTPSSVRACMHSSFRAHASQASVPFARSPSASRVLRLSVAIGAFFVLSVECTTKSNRARLKLHALACKVLLGGLDLLLPIKSEMPY